MAIDDERRKVLEMIENGKVSAAEGLHLLDVLMDTEDESETEETEPPQSSASNITSHITTHKWKWLWQIPLWVGILLIVLGAFAMFQAIRLSGFGLWFILAWLPLIAGVFWVVFAWECRSAHWFNFHIRQKTGETQGNYSFGFPMPLRSAGWFLRLFGDKISHKHNKSIYQFIHVLETQTSSQNPIFIDVNDYEEGKQVQLVIG